MRIDRVYTRNGDGGGTKLIGGQSVRKSCSQVESYGHVDELNSVLGVVKELIISTSPNNITELATLIASFQQELFNVGAELATPVGCCVSKMPKTALEQVENIERLCDLYSVGLPDLTSFVLPCGSLVAANLHFARTVARRTERAVVRFFDEVEDFSQLNLYIVQYLNRLSDLLFIFVRWCLVREGKAEQLWVPNAC